MKTLLVPLFVLLLAYCVSSLKPLCRSIAQVKVSRSALLAAPGPSGGLDEDTRERIDSVIKKNKVVLFMKGNKLFPQWYVTTMFHTFISRLSIVIVKFSFSFFQWVF